MTVEMDDTFDSDSDGRDEGEEIPGIPSHEAAKNGIAKNGATTKRAATFRKESELNKRELIMRDKANGSLIYNAVNKHMPEGIASSAAMDDWPSEFSGAGIEIVGSSSKLEVARKASGEIAPTGEEEDEEVPIKKEEAEEEEDTDGYSPNADPVRIYLRQMGSVPLLTREGEVEIAKRIEEGERRVLQVVLNSSVAIGEILKLDDQLRLEKIRVKEIVKDVDEEDDEFDEQWHVERVCKVIDKVRRLWNDRRPPRGNIVSRSTISSRRFWAPSRRYDSKRRRSTGLFSSSRSSPSVSNRQIERSSPGSSSQACL
jgi:RNA polymerase primary sigma factor